MILLMEYNALEMLTCRLPWRDGVIVAGRIFHTILIIHENHLMMFGNIFPRVL